MLSGPPVVPLATTALVLLSACATLHSPLQAPADRPAHSLSIEAHLADPDGLHLRLLAVDAQTDDELQIWRCNVGADCQQVQSIAVDERLVKPLGAGTVKWIDPLSPDPREMTYRLRHIRNNDQWLSESHHVQWSAWPDAPAPEITAPAATDDAFQVSIEWSHPPHLGAEIMRRDILSDDDEFTRIATVDAAAQSRFFDTDIEPGGVYAYRLRLIDANQPITRVGPYSSERYVSLPE